MHTTVTTTVQGELNERMFATLWKYAKYVFRFHVQGILSEAESP